MEILGPKNTVSVNTIDGFWGRLETAKQKIRKLKQRVETIQIQVKRGKRMENTEMSIRAI